MKNSTLLFFIFGILGLCVFVFFFIKTQPISLPKPKTSETFKIEQLSYSYVNPTKGAKEPKLVIYEFADILCDACQKTHDLLSNVLNAYKEDVLVVWKHFPNSSLHKNALDVSIASQCAHQQNMFWEYSQKLMSESVLLEKDRLLELADEMKMNRKKLDQCITNQTTKALVEKDLEEALSLNLVAAPTLIIGKSTLVGLPTINELTSTIEKELLLVKTK